MLWRRALIYTHRWLGIAGGALFVAWFVSGIVMMYLPMPDLTPEERREPRLSRMNRWLYPGLHSLDFPFLYDRRPFWDVVVIALSLGGLVLSLSTMPASWHRLGRHARRLVWRRP